jgi:hypothetical protein
MATSLGSSDAESGHTRNCKSPTENWKPAGTRNRFAAPPTKKPWEISQGLRVIVFILVAILLTLRPLYSFRQVASE